MSKSSAGRAPLLLICCGSIAVAAVFEWSGTRTYEFLFGGLSAVAITIAVCVLGVVALHRLEARSWFEIRHGRSRDSIAVAVLGMLLTVPMIAVDVLGGFPEGMNVAMPSALVFYPAIAVVAELTFHAIPLGAASIVWRRSDAAPWMAFVIPALIEPAFQVVWGSGHSPAWVNVCVGLHLIVFNVVGLYVFRRFGFMAMLVVRLGYYAIWHLAWGHARLTLLFDA